MLVMSLAVMLPEGWLIRAKASGTAFTYIDNKKIWWTCRNLDPLNAPESGDVRINAATFKATPHEDCAQITQSAFSSDCTDFPKEYYRISRKKCVI